MRADNSPAAGMSGGALSRAFRAHLGMPPHAWLLHRRVREAERLLREGLDPAQVVLRCGFADQSHLTRVFRQANGIAPARYGAAWRPGVMAEGTRSLESGSRAAPRSGSGPGSRDLTP